MEWKCSNEFVQLHSEEIKEDHSRNAEMEIFNEKVIEIKPIEDDNDMCNMQTSSDDAESDMHEFHDHGIDTMCTGTEIESNMSKPVIMPAVDAQVNYAIVSQYVHKTGNDIKAIVPANIDKADFELDVEEYKPKTASISKSEDNSDSVFQVIIMKEESNDIENEDAKNVDFTSKDADSVVGDSRDAQESKPSISSANFPNLTGVWAREDTAVNVSNTTDAQEILQDYCVGVQSSKGDLKVNNVTVQAPRETAVDLLDSKTIVNPWDCGESPWHCKRNPRDSALNPWESEVRPWDSDIDPWNCLKCVLCGTVCEKKSAMKVHLKTHKLYRSYPCDECDKVYNKRLALTNHKKTHSKNRQILTCTLCGIELQGEHALSKHLKEHRAKNFRTYPCEFCDKVYTKEGSLKTHLRNVHHMRGFKVTCETCGKKFKTQDNLDKHMEQHRLESSSDEHDESLHICDVCGKDCDNWAYLNVHKLIHRRPMICTSCQCGFRSLKRFIDHWEEHGIPTQPSKSPALVTMYSEASAKFPYVCTYCGEGFSKPKKLVEHITEHPQSLVQRKSLYAAPSKLLNSAVVWNEMYSSLPYVCTSCGLGFGNPKLFKIHMRAHNVNPSSTKGVRQPFKLKSSDHQGLTSDPFSEKYVLSPPSKMEN